MNERRLRRILALAVALLLTSAPAAPAAEDVTSAELQRLAARAATDPAARNELVGVRRVDGRPVDLRRALDTTDEAELQSRLRTLAGGTESGSVVADGEQRPREEARRILDGRDFRPATAPRPFRGLLRKLGEWLRPVFEPVGDALEPIGRWLAPLWESDVGRWALVAVVLLVATLLARRMVHRRTAAAVEGGRRGRRGRGDHDDPDALERDAEAAERAGDLDAAVRLRFRAGLLRLDRAGTVEVRPSTTTGQLTRRVHSAALLDLAATFEAVAYGGRPADADDVAAARRDWPRVLEEAGRS